MTNSLVVRDDALVRPVSHFPSTAPLMRRFTVVTTLVAVAFTSRAHAQAKRPMSVNDLLTAVRVGDPQLSPDGTRVLFTRTITAMPAGTRNADIWMVPADGSAVAQPFIESAKSDNSPRFIPGSMRVAFLSSRDGALQIYVADADGRNAKAVTSVSAGVQPPFILSADGRLAAFVSDAFPSCTTEACNKATRDAEEKDPVKVHTLSPAVSSLERMVGDRAPPCFRHGARHWCHARRHTRRFRFATAQLRRCGHCVLAGQSGTRLRVQA